MSGFAAVLKLGGSLARGEHLGELCGEIGRLGGKLPLLVVPGGGVFADQVRAAYRRYQLDETSAHFMAVLAMDQYGWLLSRLVPGSAVVRTLLEAQRAATAGCTPVLLPSTLVEAADPLPHSWEVTSDSIAAWIAGLVGARLVPLKDVDGLYGANPLDDPGAAPICELRAAGLPREGGGVDPYLATALARAGQELWIINGRHPARLAELLATGSTLGTRVVP